MGGIMIEQSVPSWGSGQALSHGHYRESVLKSQGQGRNCELQQCRAPCARGLSCPSVLGKTQPCTGDAQHYLPIPRAKG